MSDYLDSSLIYGVDLGVDFPDDSGHEWSESFGFMDWASERIITLETDIDVQEANEAWSRFWREELLDGGPDMSDYSHDDMDQYWEDKSAYDEEQRAEWEKTPDGQLYTRYIKCVNSIFPNNLDQINYNRYGHSVALRWGSSDKDIRTKFNAYGQNGHGTFIDPEVLATTVRALEADAKEYFEDLWERMDWRPKKETVGWHLIYDYV